MLKLSVTLKCHGTEAHACDQLDFLQGLADFCEDWVEQLHQPAWIEERQQENKEDDQKQGQKVRTVHQTEAVEWKQKCSEDEEEGRTHNKRKQKLQSARRGADTAAALADWKDFSSQSCSSARKLAMDWRE
jgi:hypothetical protein